MSKKRDVSGKFLESRAYKRFKLASEFEDEVKVAVPASSRKRRSSVFKDFDDLINHNPRMKLPTPQRRRGQPTPAFAEPRLPRESPAIDYSRIYSRAIIDQERTQRKTGLQIIEEKKREEMQERRDRLIDHVRLQLGTHLLTQAQVLPQVPNTLFAVAGYLLQKVENRHKHLLHLHQITVHALGIHLNELAMIKRNARRIVFAFGGFWLTKIQSHQVQDFVDRIFVNKVIFAFGGYCLASIRDIPVENFVPKSILAVGGYLLAQAQVKKKTDLEQIDESMSQLSIDQYSCDESVNNFVPRTIFALGGYLLALWQNYTTPDRRYTTECQYDAECEYTVSPLQARDFSGKTSQSTPRTPNSRIVATPRVKTSLSPIRKPIANIAERWGSSGIQSTPKPIRISRTSGGYSPSPGPRSRRESLDNNKAR